MLDAQTRISALLASDRPATTTELLPIVYDQLRQLAAAQLAREKPGQTLQPTALVHEAFLAVRGREDDPTWDGRRHFFCAAAEAMRRILINRARHKASLRAGGSMQRQPLDDDLPIEPPPGDLLVIDQALQKLEAVDPLAREIVNLRYFTGLTIPETAAALGTSESTVEREWRFLRTFLQDVIGREAGHDQ